jgi:hypothetical protein
MLASCAIPHHLAFPRIEQRDRVEGFIDDVGRTIVLVGVGVATLRENATVLDADYALVGRGLDRDDDLRFHEVRFQTTGLELVAGFAPLTETSYPSGHDSEVMEWSAKCEGGTVRAWGDDDLSAELYFSASATVFDAFRFGDQFAPWASITSRDGLTVREWYRGWCTDMLTLVSAATGRTESLTHMHLVADGTTVTVFTRGILQAPYYASQDRRTQVCYTVILDGGDEDSLLDVLRRVQAKR